MSTRDLEEALYAADSRDSRRRLSELASPSVNFTGSLPSIAAEYLQAFCDHAVPAAKRRWAGLVLCKLVASSQAVVNNLRARPKDLSRLGEVLLRETELEETKIIAGLVIRQALCQGIGFSSYWPSDKVPDNVPFFPQDNGLKWMSSFQTFLDTLNDLKLADLSADSAILYPVSIVVSDGFKWRDSEAVTPTILIQENTLAILTSDLEMQNFCFLEIPLGHIQCTQLRKAALHDSQAREDEHEPWDAVLSLKSRPWAYCLNESEKKGNEITILFKNHKDAIECENCIAEIGTTARSSDRGKSVTQPEGRGAVVSQEPQQSNPKDIQTEHPVAANENSIDGVADAYSSPNGSDYHPESVYDAETNANSTLVVGKVSKPQRKATSTTPPVINKNKRVGHDTKGGTHGFDDEADDFAAPPKPPRVKTLEKCKDAQVKKATTTANGSRAVNKSTAKSTVATTMTTTAAAKAKPAAPKLKLFAKPKAKPSERREFNDTEDDEDPISSQTVPQLAIMSSVDNEVLHITSSTSSSRGEVEGTQQHGSTAIKPKPSSLPKPSRVGNKRNPLKKSHGDEDVFTIPLDDEPKRRTMPKAAKKVDYDKFNSSEPESSGSDYIASKPKIRRQVGRQAFPVKERKRKGGKNSSHAKARGRKGVAKLEQEPVSPAKHTVLSALLSKTQHRKGDVDHPHAGPSKQRTELVVEKHGPVPVREISSAVAERTNPSSEPQILNHLNDGGAGMEEITFVSKTVNRSSASATHARLMQDVHVGDEESGVLPPADYVPPEPATAPVTAPERKRLATSTPPLSLKAKRVKKFNMTPDRNAGSGDISFPDVPAIIAPLRIMDEPSSPCVDIQQQQATRNQARSSAAKVSTPYGNANEAYPSTFPSRADEASTFTLPNGVEKHQTPSHQILRRTYSGSSQLSSNSKPVPAAPNAESTAISFHVDLADIHMIEAQEARGAGGSNPFTRPRGDSKETNFTRRLSALPTGSMSAGVPKMYAGLRRKQPLMSRDGHTPTKAAQLQVNLKSSPAIIAPQQRVRDEQALKNTPQQAIDYVQTQGNRTYKDAGADIDGDTLVAEEEEGPTMKAPRVHIRSSPPVQHFSLSSHSSTSAESELETEADLKTRSDDEDMEWEASLKPHQRAIGTQLVRVSKRVLRHIIDNESAINDIVETYATDGETLVNDLNRQQEGELGPVLERISKKRSVMKKELGGVVEKLKRDTKRSHGLKPVG